MVGKQSSAKPILAKGVSAGATSETFWSLKCERKILQCAETGPAGRMWDEWEFCGAEKSKAQDNFLNMFSQLDFGTEKCLCLHMHSLN